VRARAVASLLLIRHGETAWNAEHRIQGQLDIPLSTTGIRQAAQLAQRLAAEPIDAIVTSDLARARMTAEPLAAVSGLELRVEPLLKERHFGVFEGRTVDEIAAGMPDHFAAWRARDPAWAMPGGESGRQFIARVLEGLRLLATAYAGRTVAVVAHGGVLDVAYRHAGGLAWDAPRRHQMLNASVNRVRAGARAQAPHGVWIEVLDWADIAHLEQAGDERT
jgi:probable phosphoglycerate mutase